MKKLFCLLIVAVLVTIGCGDDGGDYRGSCGGDDVNCQSGECCPVATVCCSDQNFLWIGCCPLTDPECCEGE